MGKKERSKSIHTRELGHFMGADINTLYSLQNCLQRIQVRLTETTGREALFGGVEERRGAPSWDSGGSWCFVHLRFDSNPDILQFIFHFIDLIKPITIKC